MKFKQAFFWLTGPDSETTNTAQYYIRALGFIYFIVALIIINQAIPLIGSDGLLPIVEFKTQVFKAFPNWTSKWHTPSLFWFFDSDSFILALGWIALILSLLMMAGLANFFVLFVLWVIQLSFANLGSVFWAFGWESQLLEMSFLGMFLVPWWDPRKTKAPPRVVIIAIRWMVFRLMFGAGLIKLRGDSCWMDLTCMMYHYETQPNPSPLSLLFHAAPDWFHRIEVLINHFVELIVPFGLFGPKKVRRWCALFTVIFQVLLILSGNLSFLNWLTLIACIAVFDDGIFKWKISFPPKLGQEGEYFKTRKVSLGIFTVLVTFLSIFPIINLVSSRQRMNTSFEPFRLINTYGAFGAVGKTRYELVFSGTMGNAADAGADWEEYEWKCKPGDVNRAPCLITPYHYRLDWQIWFAAMKPKLGDVWVVRLAKKMLEGDEKTLDLLEMVPFPKPPAFIKIDRYEYRFKSVGEEGWWERKFVNNYMIPVSLNQLEQY